jgi:hypothetical protein
MKQKIRLKVQLTSGFGLSYRKEKIIRTLDFMDTSSLKVLAENIIEQFGFDCDHAFGIYDDIDKPTEAYTIFADCDFQDDFSDFDNRVKEKSITKARIGKIFSQKGKIMMMLFDYGDEWIFKISCMGILPRVDGEKYPMLVSSQGTAPEQYPNFDDDDDDEEEMMMLLTKSK